MQIIAILMEILQIILYKLIVYIFIMLFKNKMKERESRRNYKITILS